MTTFNFIARVRTALILFALLTVGSARPAFSQQPPQLPQVFLDTAYAPPPVPPGTLIIVNSGGNLQAALSAAQPGDIVELQAGATFTGNFTLPNKPGTSWIYVRSSAYGSLPPPGTRISPAAHAGFMPRIVTPNSEPAIRAELAAHHYRFVGIEITTTSDPTYTLVSLEHTIGGISQQTSASQSPTDIVFDRCFLHGTAGGNVRRGIALNSRRTAVIDSWLSDFHEVGADSQALAGWNGPGPFKIVNNHLEGAGENLIFGGADPLINGLVPADIEIRRNHFFKPPAWQQVNWSVKNIFELKNATRVLVEGNVLEHNWVHSQAGIAVLFTVRNQDGGCPWCAVTDVTFRKNIVRDTPGAFNISGTDDLHPSQQTARILVQDNLLYDIGDGGCCKRDFQILNIDSPDPARDGGVVDLVLDHNTARIAGTDISAVAMGDSTAAADRHVNLTLRNNLFQRGDYGIFGGGVGEGTAALNTYATNWAFEKNVVIGAPAGSYPAQSCAPAATCFPGSDAEVVFVNAGADDYRLCLNGSNGCSATSPYRAAGTDGKDIGADVEAVNAATAGVVSGAPPAGQAPFTGTPFAVPGTFQAEDFDLGGEGVASHDNVPGNAGGLYRTSEDVDIITAPGSNATGHVVNNIETGEWLEYTIDVAAAGAYTIELHASSEFTNCRFHVEIDGADVTGPVTVPDTGWWGTFAYVGATGVSLTAGTHVLRIHSEQEYFNLDEIRITP